MYLNSIQFHIFHKSALHLAAQNRNLSIIKILLTHGNIDIIIQDSQGKKPIDYSNNIEIKKLLSKELQGQNGLT